MEADDIGGRCVCWVDGALQRLGEATVPVRDLTVQRGHGVFDFFRTYSGVPLLLPHSLRRLRRSAELVGVACPYSDDQLTDAVRSVLDQNKSTYCGESGVRIVVTGGVTLDGLTPHGRSTTFVIAQPLHPYAASCYTEGVRVITERSQRCVPEAKHLNYSPAVIFASQARKLGAIEALYVNADTGLVYEGTVSNVFAFLGDTLVTPATGVLAGITRHHVLELARGGECPWKVEERDVHLDELLHADEVFLTAANKRVMPVIAVDGQSIGAGVVGPRVRRLMSMFDTITIERAKKLAPP
eukprot:TRINITY_DN18913_c0_g1_i1.p1 TRINITY_DN18913_c0_g1~~TRINITY_DN18913_c0_g1_i1.p1  ORF type:complete len:306 (-),score=75.93 TRINITY_DN18913_c0_g1_i1:48-941(-)